MTTKTCTKCKETKSVDDFYRHKGIPDGRRPDCKICVRQRTKIWTMQNKERASINNRRWKMENSEQVTLYKDRWSSQNRDRVLEMKRKWRKENPEKQKLAVLRWEKNHPLAAAQKQHRRRSRKLSNGVFEILEKELKSLYSSPCVVCGSCNEITADHIVPISRGGQHSIGNLQPMCKPCNSSKSDKFMVEWKIQRAG
jgi:5-methylcytosine-specific restriction endonuclease McrA